MSVRSSLRSKSVPAAVSKQSREKATRRKVPTPTDCISISSDSSDVSADENDSAFECSKKRLRRTQRNRRQTDLYKSAPQNKGPIRSQSSRIQAIRETACTSQPERARNGVSKQQAGNKRTQNSREQPCSSKKQKRTAQQAQQPTEASCSSNGPQQAQQPTAAEPSCGSNGPQQISRMGVAALKQKFLELKPIYLAHKEEYGVVHETTLTDLKQLGFLASSLEKKSHVKEWDIFLTLLKRALRAAGKEIVGAASFMLNEFTSVLFDDFKRWQCIEVYEAMMVSAHGTGFELCYVLDQYTWCLFHLDQLEDCEGVLLAMDLQGEYLGGFSGLYHTASCLEREGRPLAARKWENLLRTLAQDVEENHYHTLEIVADISSNIIFFAEAEEYNAREELNKLYKLVLDAFRTSPKLQKFVERAEKQRDEWLNKLDD